ncbi:unnamed protein product [Prunus armeniaca]
MKKIKSLFLSLPVSFSFSPSLHRQIAHLRDSKEMKLNFLDISSMNSKEIKLTHGSISFFFTFFPFLTENSEGFKGHETDPDADFKSEPILSSGLCVEGEKIAESPSLTPPSFPVAPQHHNQYIIK